MSGQLPVVLVHGIGSRDEGIRESKHWGRIPSALEAAGHMVFFGNQDAWGTVESNARQLAEVIELAASASETGQVVVVAHSKGGLDAQAARSLPGIGKKVASVITLSSPHNGMRFCDVLLRSRVVIPHVAARFVDAWARLRGDSRPDSHGALRDLGTRRAGRALPSAEGDGAGGSARLVSVGITCNEKRGPVVAAVFKCDGPNDGLVPLASTPAGAWVNARVANEQALGSCFRHEDCTDYRRRDFEIVADGVAYSSMADLVCSLVEAESGCVRHGSRASRSKIPLA